MSARLHVLVGSGGVGKTTLSAGYALALARSGRRVGLLGTRFTMEQEFYRGRLTQRHGLEVVVPEAEDRATVHRVIYEELCLGRVLEASRAQYRKIIGRLVEQGAQGIILGCTEISMLVDPEQAQVPVFDTTRLHAVAAAERALEGQP